MAFSALRGRQYKGLMIDVGAHFGSSLSEFARSGWRVLAFEPDTENRRVLEAHFGRYPAIHIDTRAVADHAQTKATLFRSTLSSGISGLSSFHPSHREAELVEVTTIARFQQERRIEDQKVDFLKIDTEGYDLQVLKGVSWKHAPRLILCEFEDTKTVPLGYRFHDLCRYLVERGYKLLVSEWYPVKQYGQAHQWRRFVTYPCELADPLAWGNIFACNDAGVYQRLLRQCHISPHISMSQASR